MSSPSSALVSVAKGAALPNASTLAVLDRAGVTLLVSADTTLAGLPPTLLYSVLDSSSEPLTVSQAADILDAGAQSIVSSRASQLLQDGLPAERLVLHHQNTDVTQLKGAAFAGVFLEVTGGDAASIAQQAFTALGCKDNAKTLFVRAPNPSAAADIAALGASPAVTSDQITLESAASDAQVDLVALLLISLRSDRADGLFPTVVTNPSGVSLGLVYSSKESLRESLITGLGVYQSRTRGLWRKGEISGATQTLLRVRVDCDSDALEFRVRQKEETGFCHLPAPSRGTSCFGPVGGLADLEATLRSRKVNAPAGSYTARLFSDADLLGAKIREEAAELVEAKDEDPKHVAFEAADLIYFTLARCVRAGVGLEQIENSLRVKALKVSRRKGDAKPQFAKAQEAAKPAVAPTSAQTPAPAASDAPIKMQSHRIENISEEQRLQLLQRPAIRSEAIQQLVRPILSAVKTRGDAAIRELTAKFDGVDLETPVRLPPFVDDAVLAEMKPEVKTAIDVAYSNIRKFHEAQKVVGGNKRVGSDAGAGEGEQDSVLEVETMPGVVCKRFARPIERVGLYVPGGTAILPSTALMLGVPAQVARCPLIVIASPPRKDGTTAPEVLYVASLVGANYILCAGGAQAVGAMAYGTATCPKVDKIVGPGNQFVTVAKMLVQNETDALVSIDMPAGPSEVLVIADGDADPEFVASDLLSQAEHGPDSQVVLVGIALTDSQLKAIEDALDRQAHELPRCEVVRKAIEKSVTVIVKDREQAMAWSNAYAPEHLILQVSQPDELAKQVLNAGSIFVGTWSPESCGDYASGTNHTLPTYGFARQYSGVSTSTFEKHITSQTLTAAGLAELGPHVVHLAECEGLEAHANAVRLRLNKIKAGTK